MRNIIRFVIEQLLARLTAEQIKEALDHFFDFIEDKVAESENEWDDAILLPLIETARAALDIPDDDPS